MSEASSQVSIASLLQADETGFACNKDKLVEDGIVHLRPFNIGNTGELAFDQLYRVPLELSPVGKRELVSGDILFNVTNSADLVGKAALIRSPLPMSFSNHLARLRVDRTSVLPEWFYYWLIHQRGLGTFRAQATQWVSQATFRTSQLRQLSLALPSLERQRRIVDLLSRAENIVRMRKAAEAKAKEIIPALFLEMFGDPLVRQARYAKASLKELGRVVTGSTPPAAMEGMFGGDIPFVTPGDLEVDTVRTVRHLTAEGASASRMVSAGSTLVCCIGATIGKTDIATVDCAFNQQINAVEWSDSAMAHFGTECLRRLKSSIVAHASRTALPILKKSLFEAIEVPVPPRALLLNFSNHVVRIRTIISAQNATSAHAAASFQSLLAHVFQEKASNA